MHNIARQCILVKGLTKIEKTTSRASIGSARKCQVFLCRYAKFLQSAACGRGYGVLMARPYSAMVRIVRMSASYKRLKKPTRRSPPSSLVTARLAMIATPSASTPNSDSRDGMPMLR